MARRWFELLMDDHDVTGKVFAAMEKAFDRPEGPTVQAVKDMAAYFNEYLDGCHHKKEEEHLFTLMARRGIPMEGGPLAIMIMEHEQNRVILEALTRHAEAYAQGRQGAIDDLKRSFDEYVGLLKDHFWKENDILYPMAIRVFSADDEQEVLDGINEKEAALGDKDRLYWYGIADALAESADVKDLAFGLPVEVLAAMLNTLPIELSFVDADDTVRYFSHETHDKIFPRSRVVVGRKVQFCHPPASVHVVEKILSDFKAGKRDVAEFWIDFREMKVHIRYFPVRGKDGEYLGCLETVQDVTAIQALQGQRRLLSEE